MTKRKILSLILSLILVVTSVSSAPLAAFADYEDGENCWLCGHYHWDEYMCGMCGACSDNCTDSCYIKAHCNNCGNCISEVGGYCEECNWCDDCVMGEGEHCVECNDCYVGESDELCSTCWKCPTCTGDICPDCGMCADCREDAGTHCEICGDCSLSGIEMCKEESVFHCVDCHTMCEECERCDVEEELEVCDICGLCMECCLDKAESEGCDCGEYCIESSEYQDHICSYCGTCFDAVEQCEICELCLDCCQDNSDCSDGMCIEDPEYDEHFCEDCGQCFHEVDQCHSCESANELRCENCCREYAEYEGCDCGDWCINADGFQNHLKAKHSGEGEVHASAVPQRLWSMNETYHWKECKFCDASNHITNKAKHSFDENGFCKTCKFYKEKPAYIVAHPKNIMCKTTDPDEGDVTNNTRKLSVVAHGIGKLTYQWYYQPVGKSTVIKAENSGYVISGAKTDTLTIFIPEDACGNFMRFYCVAKDSKGYVATSNRAVVYAKHNWKARNQLTKNPPASYIHSVTLKNGKTYKDYYSDGHRKVCAGCGKEKPKAKVEPHLFGASKYLGQDKNGTDWLARSCTICGYTMYESKHNHAYYDELGERVDENKTTRTAHALKCVKNNCDHMIYEPHTWAVHIVKFPGNKSSIKGAAGLDCLDCGYPVDSLDGDWTKDNYIVNACSDGTVNRFIVTKGNDIVITPFLNNPLRKQRTKVNEGKKITGWNATVKYTTEYYSEGDSMRTKTEDCTERMSFTKQVDGTWKAKITGDMPSGSYIFLDAVYGECSHTSTKIVDYKAPVCNLTGYTGDTVCKDCGKLVSTGVPINPTGNKHTGTLTKIPGTERTGSCTVTGFEGFFTCSACGERVAGKNTGYKHGATTLKNYVAPTCTTEGYSGDEYCNTCGKIAKKGHNLAPKHNNKTENYVASTYTSTGYSGDEVCTICGYLSKQGHITPVKESIKLTKLEITMPLANKTDSAASSNPFAANTYVAGGKGKVTSSFWAKASTPATKYTGTFDSGRYVANITLSEQCGDYKVTKDTKVFVNGTQCAISAVSGGFNLKYTFTPNTKITSVNIAMTLPNEADDGTKKPAMNVTSISVNVRITDSYWRDNSVKAFDKFTGGNQYKAWIALAPSAGYAIDANTFTTVYVNGEKVSAVTWDGTTIVVAPVTATQIHSWNEGVVTKKATCISGEKTYTCLNCGTTKTEKTAPTDDHMWSYEYSEGARTGYRCDECGARKTEVNEANDFYYSEDENGVTIEYYYGKSKNICIPERVGDKVVTAIGDSCFLFVENKAEIERIDIPIYVKKIGAAAFNGCSNVKNFNLPDVLESIDRTAFYGCSSLKEIVLPHTLKSIGASAFQSCTGLTELILPCGLESIGDGAFRECTGIKSVVIPDTVTTMEKTAFIGCENLETAVVGNGITEIKLSTFGSCPKLKSVVLPTSLTDITYHAFNGNDSLTTVYYRGTEAQWNNVTNTENPVIDNAKKVFNHTKKYNVGQHDEYEKTYVPFNIAKKKDGYGKMYCNNCGEYIETVKYPCPVKFTLSATSYTYDGKAKKPSMKVTYSNGLKATLTGDELTYKANKNVGTATAKADFGDGNVKTLSFKINPKGTALSKVTAGKKAFTATWKKQATQTTGYQLQYSTSSKFTAKTTKTVTVSKNGTTKTTIKKLSGKKKYYVRIRTYKTVGKTKYYSSWSKSKTVTTKK